MSTWTLLGDSIPSPLPVSDNSGTLSVDDGGGSLTVDGTVSTQGSYAEYSGSVTSNNADIVAALDVRAYKSWSIQLSGTFTATTQVQGSNDNTTWYALPLYPLNTATPAFATSLNATGLSGGQVSTRYIRVRTTAYTSGTVTGTFELSANPSPALGSYINGGTNIGLSGGTWGLADASSNSFYSAVGPVPPHIYNGTTWDRQRSANGASNTTGTGLLGVAEMYYDGTNYQRVSNTAPLPVILKGSSTASVPATVSIGTSSGTILAARSTRRSMVVQNNHATNALYLGFGSAPTTSNGIKVAAGSTYSDEGFTGAVYGIADGASTDVRVVEFD